MIRTHRRPPSAPAIASAMMLAASALLAGLMLGGCSDDSLQAPGLDDDPPAQAAPPALPDPAQLNIDVSFFDEGAQKTIGRQNFHNAYLRAVIVTAVTRLVLVPPVSAFALALHTVPTPQPDGSWIWVYTYVRGAHEVQIRLRGKVEGDEVAWALRLTAPAENLYDALWFDGATREDGDIGRWTFYDLNLPQRPAAAAVTWHNHPGGHELSLEALRGADAGDVLTFTETGDQRRIEYFDAQQEDVWFIRWDESDRTGSLRVPDYRNGQESCWDEQLYDVDCGA